MFYRLIRALRVCKNKIKYKFSPKALINDIQSIINENFFDNPARLVKALDDFEGVIDYNYDAHGNFEATLASGISIKIVTQIIERE